jgi:pimeloyl-ACP methyl ester carboxylesterase
MAGHPTALRTDVFAYMVRSCGGMRRAAPIDPPPIPGVRRSFVDARGVRFHVTEAGPPDARPVLALHGWPQHHYLYRHLLADPPPGMRIIAPDLPGYGWSGPPPHRWAKEDVASDVLALLDALGLARILLVGHDWGGSVGFLLALRTPERVDGYLTLNMAHPWQTLGTAGPHLWRVLTYMPLLAALGVPIQRRTRLVERILRGGLTDRDAMSAEDVRWFADRFRDPVCARAGRDTYRTFLVRELIAGARQPERRRAVVPIRVLHGTDDFAVHRLLVSEHTALADDYSVEYVDGCGHFIADERPGLVRDRLVALATQANPTRSEARI